MHVYHVRREGQTTYVLQFLAQSIQNVRECKSYISCEIRHNYTIFGFGVQCKGSNATPYGMGEPSLGGGWGCVVVGEGVGVLGGFLCSSSPTTSRDVTWTPNCWNYQDLSYTSEFIWCESWNIWGPICHSFSFGLLIAFDRPYPRYNISEIYDDASSVSFCPIWHSACWFLF